MHAQLTPPVRTTATTSTSTSPATRGLGRLLAEPRLLLKRLVLLISSLVLCTTAGGMWLAPAYGANGVYYQVVPPP